MDDHKPPSRQTRAELLRKAAMGGGVLAAASLVIDPSPDAAQADTAYVPRTEPQAASTFLPVFVRTPDGRPAGSALGFYTGTTVFNGTVDPFIALGYFGGAGDWLSTFQLEGDWDTGPGAGQPHITEMYWQIIKPDGASRRPMYGQYDRTLGRAVQWIFMIGNGVTDTGVTSPYFAVNWDNDTSQSGVGLFSVSPNRLDVNAVSTGGVAADQTKIRMYSAPGYGSSLALSYGGEDPESFSTAYYLYTGGPTLTHFAVGGGYIGRWRKPSATTAALQMIAGIGLGDGTDVRLSLWGATGTPAKAVGNNGDWAISDDGHLYFKSAGAWVRKV